MTTITTRFPEHKFIAEETAAEAELTDDVTWIIDPLDGARRAARRVSGRSRPGCAGGPT